MDVFFAESPERDFFDGLLEYNQNIKWNIFEEENKDWLEEWKKGFKPFRLVGDFWVVPSWLTPPPECKHPIYIDPGMAFGTGPHALPFRENRTGKFRPFPCRRRIYRPDGDTGSNRYVYQAARPIDD
jgi:hypothetical protein